MGEQRSIRNEQVSDTLAQSIREFGSAKDVARAAGCSVATAGRYQRGETIPDAVAVARLMAASHRIVDAMLRMAGLDDVSLALQEQRLENDLAKLRDRRIAANATGVAEAGRRALPDMGGNGQR
jgi:transcriptional regulator with XRE-family HTH domain